jgi:hypothetical protein
MEIQYADVGGGVTGLARRLAHLPRIRAAINRNRLRMGLPLIPAVTPRIDPVLIADASAALARLKAAMRSN